MVAFLRVPGGDCIDNGAVSEDHDGFGQAHAVAVVGVVVVDALAVTVSSVAADA